MELSHLGDVMELVFEHKETVQEQKYIDMCNCLKDAHLIATSHRNIVDPIETRIAQVSQTYNTKLNNEYKQISKPFINNEMKFIAMYDIARRHNFIEESIQVTMCVDPSVVFASLRGSLNSDEVTSTPVKSYLHIRRWLGNEICLDQGLYCVANMQRGKKCPPQTKLVNDMKKYLQNHGSEILKKDLKDTLKTVQHNAWVKMKNKFFDDHLQPLLDEIRFLENILEQMSYEPTY